METVLPETDKIKTSLGDLDNIKAHKLAQIKWDSLKDQSNPIEVRLPTTYRLHYYTIAFNS